MKKLADILTGITIVEQKGNENVSLQDIQFDSRKVSLNDLFVAENARKKGVARQLIQAATHYARTLGAVRVSLSTSISNAAAQATYESLGWKRDEQFFYYHFVV